MLTLWRTARLRAGGAVPILLLSQILVNIGVGTFGVLYNLYLTTIGQSLAFIGTFNAVSILALGASALPIGAVTRAVGHRRTLAIGSLLLVAVQVVLALTSAPAPLLLAGVIWGVAQALSVVPVAPLLSESVPRTQRATAFGRLYAAWALATVVGSLLGGILPGLLATLWAVGPPNGSAAYRGALLITTAITSLGWPLLLTPMAALDEQRGESPVDAPLGHGWALASVRRTACAVTITMGLYSCACGLVGPFMNVYFADQLHEATALIGVLFAVASLLGVVGSLLGPRLSWRLGSVRAVALIRVAIVPCLLALMLGDRLPLVAMIGFVLRFALVFTAGALDSHFTLAAVPARSRPLLSGLRTGTYNLFFALGSWGAGHLIPQLGYSVMFLWSVALTTAASVLFFGLFGLPLAAP